METCGQTLPKECILLVNFQLNENNKLANATYKYLKDTYENKVKLKLKLINLAGLTLCIASTRGKKGIKYIKLLYEGQ